MTRHYRILQKDGLYYTQVRQFCIWMTMDAYGSKIGRRVSDFASNSLETAIKKAVDHENNIQVSERLARKAKTIWTWRSDEMDAGTPAPPVATTQ